jgi:hypothetical protein
MKHHHQRLVVLTVLVCLTQTGCLTKRLWENEGLRSFYEPATDAHLALFVAMDGRDVLVRYDEQRESDDAVRQRAFFLQPNLKRLEARLKPRFIDPAVALKLERVPTVEAAATNAVASRAQVRLRDQGDRFILLQSGEELGPYTLPTYPDSQSTVARVLLTPLAVTGDLVIVGSVVGIWVAYAKAGASVPLVLPTIPLEETLQK